MADDLGAVRAVLTLFAFLLFIPANGFWVGVTLSAAYSRIISRWLRKRRKRQTQSAAHEPMTQAPTSSRQIVDGEMGMSNTTETTRVNSDQELGSELGEFIMFASRFGMHWICSSRVTRCWKFSFPWFLVLFFFVWTAYVVYVILTSLLNEHQCFNSVFFGNNCPGFRSQLFESAIGNFTSIGNPFILWFIWRRCTNPVAKALVHMQSVTPDLHIQCCKFAKRVFACCVVLSALVSIATFFVVLQLLPFNFRFNYNPTFFPLFLLPSHVMVATFAFVFYIVRHRLRAFVALVHYAHSSGQPLDIPDVPLLLKIVNCPIAMVREWTSIAQNGSTDDDLKWLRLQLHRLWMTQIRQANKLVNRNSVWLGFQALVVLVQLIGYFMTRFAFPLILFTSSKETTPSGTWQTLLDVNSIESNVRTFEVALCPVAALFFLALTRWHIDRVCLQIEAALETKSSVADSSEDTTLQKDVCNGEDSLGSLLAFCRASSVNTLQVFGLPMNFASLLKYFYLIGLTFGLVAAYVRGRSM
jgi:hypothetical protein